MRYYVKNENYFEVINTEQKAYFLGLLFADGTNASDRIDSNGKLIKRNQIALSLKMDDKHIFDSFLLELESNYRLRVRKNSLRNENWSDQCMLTITSAKMSEDLSRLGCIPNKTKSLNFPTNDIIPKELMHHFIRGYFDGDGCVWIGKRYPFTFNDGAIGRRRTRIIHNMKFTFVGLDSFIESVKTNLIDYAGFSNVKINYHKRKEKSASLEYSGKNNIIKLYNYMYKDATVFLKRKEVIFKSLL